MRIGYLLYGEVYSGVIDSQALDVVRYYNQVPFHQAVLFAAIPLRNHHYTSKQLAEACQGEHLMCRAMPQRLLRLAKGVEVKRMASLLRQRQIDILICRNALACSLALAARKHLPWGDQLKICYDGRGALSAEDVEYDVYPHYLKQLFREAERRAVLESDYRIAVTQELVNWWSDTFDYHQSNHLVIPTTISTEKEEFSAKEHRSTWREKLQYESNEIVLAFAGGRADWQSLSFWLPKMPALLDRNPHVKLLLLTPPSEAVHAIVAAYPSRVLNTFLPHEDVLKALSAADYGILWREVNVTNAVASPTKMGEYVQAGLPVLVNRGTAAARIAEELGHAVCMEPGDLPMEFDAVRDESTFKGTMFFKKSTYYMRLVDAIVKNGSGPS